jgi:hypothetical protein
VPEPRAQPVHVAELDREGHFLDTAVNDGLRIADDRAANRDDFTHPGVGSELDISKHRDDFVTHFAVDVSIAEHRNRRVSDAPGHARVAESRNDRIRNFAGAGRGSQN